MNNFKCKAEPHDHNGRNQAETNHKKNMELCLEVEMDDEVREIIKSPDGHSSALLDVTVIKPNGLECLYTTEKKTLNSNDVRRLIASMEIEQQGKKALLEKIFSEKPKQNCFQEESFDFEQGDVHCMVDDKDSAVFSMYKKHRRENDQRMGDHEGVKQVFTTPRTYNNIKSIFQCKNKHEHEENRKPNKPCLCQNCAIVGILTDSQKNPFAEEVTYDTTVKFPRRKKSVSFKQESEHHEECHYYFKQLSARIRDLEERIAIQEDRAVPKDYFKRIISKLVNHITKLTHYSTDIKSLHTDKYNKDTYGFKANNKYENNKKYAKYYVNHVLVDENRNRIPAERDLDESQVNLSDLPPRTNVWKWGSEILKPGIDLKNKIVVLLEDTLNSLKKGWERPRNDSNNEDIKKFVEDLSKNLYKTINEKNKENSESFKREKRKQKEERHIKKNFLPKFTLKRDCCEDNKVNIKYVNPKLSTWNEESAVSFKVGSADFVPETSSSKQYKQEFLKALKNTKTSDKLILWQTIWDQAQTNGQNISDKVTIQIPFNKDSRNRKMVEIQYTLAEIQQLLSGDKEKQ